MAEDFVREVRDNPRSPLNPFVARYTHAFLSMRSIAEACNRLHTVDQRLCRWPMLVQNRTRRDEFEIRHEFLAQMLGVQRPTVSTTAAVLQNAGFIAYSRGRMRLLDIPGLVRGSCECLELMEKQMDRIFAQPWREMVRKEDENVNSPVLERK